MRYAPAREFPPYPFLPGQDPHPTRDERGHSFGQEEGRAIYLPAVRWSENEDYLYGVDLYNHGFLWEAHEAWERLWHAAKQDARQAEHLQGLIQCAAACLKVRMQQPRGLVRLAELGTDKLARIAAQAGGSFMGVDLEAWVPRLREFAGSEPESIDGRPPLQLD